MEFQSIFEYSKNERDRLTCMPIHLSALTHTVTPVTREAETYRDMITVYISQYFVYKLSNQELLSIA